MTLWITASASVTGAGHAHNADRFRVTTMTDGTGQDLLVIALADGAGSARYGHRGAALSVNAFIRAATRAARGKVSITQNSMRCWHSAARRAALQAPSPGETLSDYNSTFLGVVIGVDAMGCVQTGDGAIVFEQGNGSWRVATWPQRGQFANETCFLGDREVEPDITILAPPPSAFAVFCDGFEPLALNESSRTVAAPLFAAMTNNLIRMRHRTPTARDTTIGRMLRTPFVQSRVHDDCTLILAAKPEGSRVRRHSR